MYTHVNKCKNDEIKIKTDARESVLSHLTQQIFKMFYATLKLQKSEYVALSYYLSNNLKFKRHLFSWYLIYTINFYVGNMIVTYNKPPFALMELM
jgi:hypothetical protein